jgi:hypothetical protein
VNVALGSPWRVRWWTKPTSRWMVIDQLFVTASGMSSAVWASAWKL